MLRTLFCLSPPMSPRVRVFNAIIRLMHLPCGSLQGNKVCYTLHAVHTRVIAIMCSVLAGQALSRGRPPRHCDEAKERQAGKTRRPRRGRELSHVKP